MRPVRYAYPEVSSQAEWPAMPGVSMRWHCGLHDPATAKLVRKPAWIDSATLRLRPIAEPGAGGLRWRSFTLKLPNGSRAIIDGRKIADYCLNPDHDDGRHKAHLFQALTGLNRDNAGLLVDALREAAASGDAAVGKVDRYGRRHVIDFEFTGPNGTAMIRSAWIVRTRESVPRLVTCYILRYANLQVDD